MLFQILMLFVLLFIVILLLVSSIIFLLFLNLKSLQKINNVKIPFAYDSQ